MINLEQYVDDNTHLHQIHAMAFGYLTCEIDSFLQGHLSKESLGREFVAVMEFVARHTERLISTGQVDQVGVKRETLKFIRGTEKEAVTGQVRKHVNLGKASARSGGVTKR